jgi:hypothetical protein
MTPRLVSMVSLCVTASLRHGEICMMEKIMAKCNLNFGVSSGLYECRM